MRRHGRITPQLGKLHLLKEKMLRNNKQTSTGSSQLLTRDFGIGPESPESRTSILMPA